MTFGKVQGRESQFVNLALSDLGVVEGLYYPYSKNKGADQLHSNCATDLRLCFRICKSWFSHNEAHICFDKKFLHCNQITLLLKFNKNQDNMSVLFIPHLTPLL